MNFKNVCHILAILNTSNTLAITPELLVSIVAIVISILSMLFTYRYTNKISRTTLRVDFYSVFVEYLVKKLPKTRQLVTYNKGHISGTNALINTLNELRQDAVYFKYTDSKYYKQLCEKLQEIEDKLVETDELTHDDFSEFNTYLNSEIENIYSLVMDKYLGKR